MKTLWISLFAAALAMTGCDEKKDGDAKSDDKGGDSGGLAECDTYFKAMDACPDAMKAGNKAAKEAMESSIKAATSKEGKDALATSCKAAADALKSAGCK